MITGMTIGEAWEIVYDLATENYIDPRDAEENDMPDERSRQEEAVATIDDAIQRLERMNK